MDQISISNYAVNGLNPVFKSMGYRSDGKHKVIRGDSKKEAQKFLDNTHIKYDHEKAKKAGFN